MKTRIISAAVLIAVLGGIVVLGFTVSPFFVTALLVAAAVIGVYELLNTALKIKIKLAVIVSCITAGVYTLLLDDAVIKKIFSLTTVSSAVLGGRFVSLPARLYEIVFTGSTVLPVIFVFFAAAVILLKHNDFDLGQAFAFIGAPLFLAHGFSSIGGVLGSYDALGNVMPVSRSVYHLLLMLTFACVCDTGAYFVGVTMGKHKLCPEISPKKTVEGAVGGIISAIVVVIILMVAFKITDHILATVIFTIPLCILGMMGDLFASIIKRKVGIKDYGNLIPGHGGVLDRFDSMLFIAPALYMLIAFGVI